MTKRKMPVKSILFELKGEDYEGWWARVRTNAPAGLVLDKLDEFDRADKEKLNAILPLVYEVLELVIIEWNFVDEKGKDLPTTLAGFRQLPTDLLLLMMQRVTEVIGDVPLPSNAS